MRKKNWTPIMKICERCGKKFPKYICERYCEECWKKAMNRGRNKHIYIKKNKDVNKDDI